MSPETRKKISRVFSEEKDRLLAFIRRQIGRLEDAEDILQDVFLSTLSGVTVTESIENIAGWLYISARNRVIDYYRKKHRTVPVGNAETASLTLESIWSDRPAHPDEQYFRQVLAETLSGAIDRLPDAQKQVVIWQMIEGRTFQEIADMTGEPVNTLISRKRYAVQALRRDLNRHRELFDETIIEGD